MSWQSENRALLKAHERTVAELPRELHQHVEEMRRRVEDARAEVDARLRDYDETKERNTALVLASLKGARVIATREDEAQWSREQDERDWLRAENRKKWRAWIDAGKALKAAEAQLAAAEYQARTFDPKGDSIMFLAAPPPRGWAPDHDDDPGPDPALIEDRDDAAAASEPPGNIEPASKVTPTEPAKPGLKQVLKGAAAHRGGKAGRP